MLRQDPALARDNFLRPVDYQPQAISLDEIKYLVRRAWFERPNIMIVPDDVDLPLDRQLKSARLLRFVRSRQPTWKLYILLRRMQIGLGIARIKRWLWERKQDPAWKARSGEHIAECGEPRAESEESRAEGGEPRAESGDSRASM
jgi:hypothetical protein